MKRCSLLFLFLFSVHNISAQEFPFADKLYKEYSTFKEEQIEDRRFKHSDIEPLIKQLSSNDIFTVSTAGYSVEGRPVYLIKLGTGDTNVLLWSQMHGDESTATMAIFDIFNFFGRSGDGFDDKRKFLLQNVSLYFLPMLNPDGAQHFQRRNAIGIDINRDALDLTTPEARILKSVRDSLQPEFGFNLHDQSTYYAVGRTPEPATLSFLAPAYDFERSVNDVRRKAMQLIGYIHSMLQQYIPGKVATYSDAHEPRAFGDMITKWGTSTILIESGGYPDDPEKQYLRKLNFVSILTAFDAIAGHRYTETSIDSYNKIPQNNRALTDLLIRKTHMIKEGEEYLIDLSIRQWQQMLDYENYYYRSAISNLGDLSTSYGYEEIEGNGMIIHPGKIYPDTLQNLAEAQQLPFTKLLRQGYTGVVVEEAPDAPYLSDIPLNIIVAKGHSNEIRLGAIPNLYIEENGQIRYVIVNGYVFDTEEENTSSIQHTLVIE